MVGEEGGGVDTQSDFAAGADEDQVGLGHVAQHVRALRHVRIRALGALEHRQVLATQDEAGRAVAVDRDPKRMRGLVRVGRADQPQAGHRPERGEVLDGLMGRAVVAERH